jgi:hypothetical protein
MDFEREPEHHSEQILEEHKDGSNNPANNSFNTHQPSTNANHIAPKKMLFREPYSASDLFAPDK